MKKYKIIISTITGQHGRIMKKGEIVPETYLLNVADHILQGHISEHPEAAAAPAEEPKIKKVKQQ